MLCLFDLDGTVTNRVRGFGVLRGFGSRGKLARLLEAPAPAT